MPKVRQKISRKKIINKQHLLNSFLHLQMDWGNSFQDILKNNKRRYVYFLYMKSLGNLITMETRERYNGSHAIAWAVIIISVSKGFS